MCWIVYALPICFFIALLTLRVLSFEPFKFMDYTPRELREYTNNGIYIIVNGTWNCLKVFYFVIGTVLGFILYTFLHNSFIKVLTGIGGGVVIVGTAFAVVVVFIFLDKLLKKICNA